MFNTYFKFNSQPFKENPLVENIIKDNRLNQGIARLEYLAKQGSIGLITGLSGIGKSTLIKLFLSTLSAAYYEPIYINFTNVRSSSFFKLIISKMGEVPKLTKEQNFLQIIHKTRVSKIIKFLIIDEAHLLKTETLIDLRLLISSALDGDLSLKIIFVGQSDIRDILKRNFHADLNDRISVRYHFNSLSKPETVTYIDSQLLKVGGTDKSFDLDVKEAMHEYSNGIPRQINNIATGCLLNAYSKKMQKINQEILAQTMNDLQY